MTATYPKRLIEVDLPIRQVSEHARREKSTPTITSMHLWWARRPLAACRAVTMAALWPDPVDENCPTAFRAVAELHMIDYVQRRRGRAPEHFKASELRESLLQFVADYANPDNANDPFLRSIAVALTDASYGGPGGAAPLVVDPFSGGGSIPVEALRVGAETFASDLNPVAVLITHVLVQLAPRHRARLSESVLTAGRWVAKRAAQELASYYPAAKGARPIAYLWARTVLSNAPGTKLPVEVPLIRSMWLAKKGDPWALRWVTDRKGNVVTKKVERTYADGTTRPVLRPELEVFAPRRASEVGGGTTANAAATSPLPPHFTTPKADVRAQLAPRRGGANDARLLCVVSMTPGLVGRSYRVPSDDDLRGVASARKELARRIKAHSGLESLVPDEEMPTGRVWKNNPFRTHLYGVRTWGDLFTDRQALALATLSQNVREIAAAPEFAEWDRDLVAAVQTVLSLSVSREADHLNSGCAWNPSGPKLQHLFQRQAISMIWDFCEANPFGGSVGDWLSMVEGAVNALGTVGAPVHGGQAVQASATKHPLPDGAADAFITDPPYYDSVPYADLSDFFYVWLKRTVPPSVREWFRLPVVDRDQEAVYDENRGKDRAFYVKMMRDALAEGRRILKPDGIGVVVFAHKSTAGWEALLEAIIDAGWSVTGSWPIDTELATRVRAMKSAALASSVHIVCRPRTKGSTAGIGDWREVLGQLPVRIHEWMPRLAAEGVVGADAIFACLGPALEIFSRYERVEKASGEDVTLKEYLENVWAAVAKEALGMIFVGADATGFEEDARLTAMWLWTLSAGVNGASSGDEDAEGDPGDEGEESSNGRSKARGFGLEYDAARKIAQGLGAHLEDLRSLVEVKGDTATLLSVAERAKALFGNDEESGTTTATAKKRAKKKQLALRFDAVIEEAEEAGGWGGDGVPEFGTTVLDRVHQAMLLFAANRGAALKRFIIEDGAGKDERFWRLAQALSALYPSKTDEKRWIDGVLARKKGLGF